MGIGMFVFVFLYFCIFCISNSGIFCISILCTVHLHDFDYLVAALSTGWCCHQPGGSKGGWGIPIGDGDVCICICILGICIFCICILCTVHLHDLVVALSTWCLHQPEGRKGEWGWRFREGGG